MVLCLTFFQDVVMHTLNHYAIDRVYVVHSSGRYTPPNHYIFLIVSSIKLSPQPSFLSRIDKFSFHLTKLRLSIFFLPLHRLFFWKSNPIFTVSSTHQTSFFCCWTFWLWKSYLCNVRRIVWLHSVFLVVFSTIPCSFRALSLGFFRILSSTYLSCLALSTLVF